MFNKYLESHASSHCIELYAKNFRKIREKNMTHVQTHTLTCLWPYYIQMNINATSIQNKHFGVNLSLTQKWSYLHTQVFFLGRFDRFCEISP